MTEVVIWADKFDESAEFYRLLLAGSLEHASEGFVEVCSANNCIKLHKVPAEWASEISNPPVIREDNPLKPIFVVDSIAKARAAVGETAGHVETADKEFRHGDSTYCNAVDPDGNVVQLSQLG